MAAQPIPECEVRVLVIGTSPSVGEGDLAGDTVMMVIDSVLDAPCTQVECSDVHPERYEYVKAACLEVGVPFIGSVVPDEWDSDSVFTHATRLIIGISAIVIFTAHDDNEDDLGLVNEVTHYAEIANIPVKTFTF